MLRLVTAILLTTLLAFAANSAPKRELLSPLSVSVMFTGTAGTAGADASVIWDAH